MEESISSNPVVAALLWVFNQIISDPDIIKKVITITVAVLVLRVILAIAGLIQTARRKKWREQYDRAFSAEQRYEGFQRAGERCEFDSGFGRCGNRAEHADHFYPWSRGGATSMKNLVAACSGHNLSKGAKMPSAVLKSRIESRRKGYFPKHVETSAGEWSVRRKGIVNQQTAAGTGWAEQV